MLPSQRSYDVAVVGAGPAGCVSAIAHARKGARVLLLEAEPRAAARFAGEWLHPTGVDVLDELRIGRLDDALPRTGYGFVIFPDDGSAPIEMPYTRGIALSCEHETLVHSLRDVAASHANVELALHARAVKLDGRALTLEDRESGRSSTIVAERIVGADGRRSFVRKSLEKDDASSDALSYMAAVELRGLRMPFEGFGHLVLGGPGPALFYRINEDVVRGCLDVPVAYGPAARSTKFLWDGFSPVLPPVLRAALREALESGPSGWAINRFRPRSLFGKGHVALVGDAVGHVHPMTAMGMTLGFLDARALAEANKVEDYAKARRSYVPELLSNALYHCFRREDASATAIRRAMFDTLREDERERGRTMDVLAGADPSRITFGGSFLRIAARAIGGAVSDGPTPDIGTIGGRLKGFREWMQWPAALVVPAAFDRAVRQKSTTVHPIPQLRAFAPVGEHAPLVQSERAEKEVALTEAIERGTDDLLRELELIAARFGSVPDAVLAGPALSCMRAIVATKMSAGMAARMTLGRRRLALEGFPRLLSQRDPDCRHWAELILLLLDGSPWRALPIERLAEGVRALLMYQGAAGGFARSSGELASGSAALDFELTALAMRALEVLERERPEASGMDVSSARERALHWAAAQQKDDGSFGDASKTAWGLEILLAGGAHPGDPSVRRAVSALSTQMMDESDRRALARGLRALLSAGVTSTDAILHAARCLAAEIEDDWEALSETIEALAACEARRASRPRGRRRGEGQKSSEGNVNVETRRARSTGGRGMDGALRSDWEFCKASLADVSRTFSRPIELLPPKLEVAVSLGYLLCRAADTIEDHTAVEGALKDELFAKFLKVLEHNADAHELAEAFASIDGDDAELTLIRQLPRVMRVFDAQDEHVKATCRRWVAEMARGMSLYGHRPAGEDGVAALYTIADLERYCYYVAGTVGHLLTDLFADHIGADPEGELVLAMRDNAEAFAAGLQLTNILKDVTDDFARGVSFIPRTECTRSGFSVAQLTDADVRAQAHEAVTPLFELARGYLDRALAYSLTIPADHPEIRRFCLLPLWMAARTLVLARGNDAMFTAGEPVKISRAEVESLIAECMAMAGQDEELERRYAKLFEGAWPVQAEPNDEGRKVG
ncbi:MAG: squalene/phytoene synthase family protein [Sandaracinaceae bacterium]